MELTILQWNIWYMEDVAKVVAFLKAHPADVVCLQEMTIGFAKQAVRHVPDYIAHELGYESHYHESPIESPDGVKVVFVNGIFSRFEMVERRFAWINQPKQGGGYGDEYRVYVEATLAVGEGSLSAGTTHMSYTHRLADTSAKQAETERLVAELRRRPRRQVFTGDLNAVPGSATIRAIERVMRSAGPDYAHKTWTTKPFSYHGFEARELNWRLDYVFATPDIEVIEAKVLATDLSDHLPVLVTVRV